MLTNWRTTAAGIAAILITLGTTTNNILQGHPIDIALLVGQLSAGVGLILAKDSNVTGGTVKQ